MGAGSIKWLPMDPFKILVIVMLFAIIGSLGSALFHFSRNKSGGEEESRKMARALTVRVSLSVVLFILLMLAWYNGLITPHGLS